MSASAKPWTLNSALDPADFEPDREALKRAVKTLEWRGIRAIPVYARWLRVDLSNHEALFQESGHHDTWPHVELSLVHGAVPMYQKFTGNVYGDFNAMALKGHDVGPFVVHGSVPPTNMLTGLHILSSSCEWPISAKRRLHRGESFCAFAWLLAPYLYCNAEKKQDSSSNKAEPNDGWPKGLASGVGICMVPTGGKTIWMRLSFLDIMLGWADLGIKKAISKAFDKIWIVRGRDAKRHIRPFTNAAARKAGYGDVGRYMRDMMLDKAWKDAGKGFATKWEVGIPFKLASCDFGTGHVKVWTYTFGGWKEPRPEQPARVQTPNPTRPGLADREPAPQAMSSSPPQREAPRWDIMQDQWLQPEPQEPLGPYDPRPTILDELLEGVPHAW